MRFTSKATTLEKLSNMSFTKCKIPKIYYFTEKQFLKNKDKIFKNIRNRFKNRIAIRSSCLSEDTSDKSFAGHFYSSLNIDPSNEKVVYKEIKKVLNSYKNFKNLENQILIQEMVAGVRFSGVAMTSDKDNLAPYYIVDFVESKDTTTVTAGSGSKNKTFVFEFIIFLCME